MPKPFGAVYKCPKGHEETYYFLNSKPGQSKVRLVTDNPAKAKKALAGENLQVSEEEVVGVKLAIKPGTLAAAASKLGGAGVNISHGYTGAEEGTKEQLVVLAVSDLKQATKVLK
jgi:hypothetical protein